MNSPSAKSSLPSSQHFNLRYQYHLHLYTKQTISNTIIHHHHCYHAHHHPTTHTPPPPLPQIPRFVMLLSRQYYQNHFFSKMSLVIPSQHLSTKPPSHGETKTKTVQQSWTRRMQPPYHGATTSTTIYSLNSSRHFANKSMALLPTSWTYWCHHHTW